MRIKAGSLLAGAAVLVAAPLATLAFGSSASAVTSQVVCTKLVGTTQLKTANLSGCDAGSTGGSGAIANFSLNGGDVTWANGTTTDYTATATHRGTTCPTTSEEFKIVGSVTASTNSSTPVGQVVNMKVCFNQHNFVVRNVTGTTVKF
jgi:hypothetical protein